LAQENRRLSSWKDIAEYLGRDVRTVIRWEKEKSLPVRRIPGKRTAVFAHSEEIDSWMLSGGTSLTSNGQPGGDSDLVSSHAPSLTAPRSTPAKSWVQSRFPRSRSAYSVAGAVLLLVTAGLWMAWPRSLANSPRTERPLRLVRADYAAAAPRGLVTGDFNHDGKADLAFTNSREGTVAVLLGDGYGAFPTRAVSQTTLAAPERLVAGDFDGDGQLDLAVTSYDGGSEVEVLLGRGDGSFQKGSRLDVGGRARWVSAGDLDLDGKMDLVVAASFAARVVVLLGNGDGRFREGARYEAELDVSSLALVDVNRDGFPDVIASDYRMATSSSVSVYLNDGKGALGPRESFSTARGPLGLAVGDFNQDGQADVVTANFPFQVSILLGTSPATFAEPVNLPAGRGNGFAAVADLDRDGFQDLLVLGEHSNTCSLFFGDGRGGFEPPQDFPTSDYPDAAVVADFDRDQNPDIAIASIQGDSISVLLNRTPLAQTPRWLARLNASRSTQQ